MQPKINIQDIYRYSRNHREGQVSHTFNNIKYGKMMEDVLETEVGERLLGDAIFQMNSLSAKILDKTATDEEHAIYKAYREIIGTWARRIDLYSKSKNKIIKERENARTRSKPR